MTTDRRPPTTDQDERELKQLVARHLPAPSHMEFVAARDRVLSELRAAPPHLQKARLEDARGSGVGGQRSAASWLRTAVPLAAAVALFAVVATVSFKRGDWLATVEAADGSKYTLKPNEVIHARDANGAMLTLVDGSRIEMRAASELSLERAADGLDIRLRDGDIIVNASTQHDGHLYVHTKDVSVTVEGTVFLVNAASDGSRVAVIEGEVRVREGAVEKRLRPGEELATGPTIARRSVREEVSWSRNADVHQAILDSFMKGMAQTAAPLTPLARLADVPGAQTPNAQAAALEFEEASIRPCDPDNLPPLPPGTRGGGENSVMMTPGRFYALCVTPATLIRSSHGYRAVEVEALVPDGPPNRGGRAPIRGRFGVVGGVGAESGRRVRGGPDWVRKERYTIEAIAEPTATSEEMSGPMLRALFEKRFKLKTHVETEQTTAYNLVVSPGGLKIKPVSSGACEVPVGRPGMPLVNGLPQPVPRSVAELRRGAKPLCGVLGGPNGPNWVSIAGEGTFAALTQMLRGRFGNGIAVTDKTGITDKFNWDLESAVDANAPISSGAYGILETGAAADVPRAPTISVALEEQLGLRLEPTQVPREYLVIDAIERPGAN